MRLLFFLLLSAATCCADGFDPAVLARSFQPNRISGLVVWLNPSSGFYTNAGTTVANTGEYVYRWADASGNGNHAEQSTFVNQAIRGIKGLEFTIGGHNSYYGLTNLSRVSTNISIFIVGRMLSEYFSQAGFSATSLNPSFLPNESTSGPGVGNVKLYDTGVRGATPQFKIPLTLQTMAAVLSSSASVLNIEEDTRSLAAMVSATGTSATLFQFNSSRYWNNGGLVYEVLIYNRALSTQEAAFVRHYLRTKYLTPNPAAATKQIIYDGDSLTMGTASTNCGSYPFQMSTQLPGYWKHISYGVSGRFLSVMLSEASANIDSVYNASLSNNVVVIWGGSNDIANNGKTDAQVFTNLWSYCAGRRTAGFKVIALTMLPRALGATQEGYRTNYNASIVANWASFADGLANVAADSRLSAYSTNYYNADATHLNNAGYAVVSELVLAAVNALP